MNILSKRYLFFAFSLLIIIPGLVLALMGLPLSIDFTGGSLLEVKFENGTAPQPEDIISIYNNFGITDVQVQTTKTGVMIARSSELTEGMNKQIEAELGARYPELGAVTEQSFETVGATVGKEVANRAAEVVAIAAAAVVLYIWFAFRKLAHALRYGLCAIIAMLHDILIVVALGSIGGRLFGWQVDALYLTALLTVIGFSVQDKVVVFDRIRENSGIYRKLPFERLVNHSIIQTLQRSINTQLMTVEFMLLALALFGGVTLREFAVILLVGLFSGTYSSIFIAASILVVWENKEWKKWFHRGGGEPAAA
jgi:preprotein translocase subunit SecF